MKNNKILTILLCVISIVILSACDENDKKQELPQTKLGSYLSSSYVEKSYKNDYKSADGYSYRKTALMRNIDESADNIKRIIESGADVNERDNSGNNVLHYISSKTSPEVVQILVDAGVNVNAKDQLNRIPLVKLCSDVKQPNLEILNILIKAKSDVNSKDSMFKCALSYLIKNEDIDAIKLLVANGADVNIGLVKGTLMHEAVSSGNVEIINFLASKGGILNYTDRYLFLHKGLLFNTPLMFAIEEGASLDVINALLDNKADPNYYMNSSSGPYNPQEENKKPKTVLELAIKHQRSEEIIKTLLKHGAKVTHKAVNDATYLKNTQTYWQMRDAI